tara:strand:- start:3796 stop:4389 length:594 start_codon:yes stop_codon:yes gene_type:complete
MFEDKTTIQIDGHVLIKDVDSQEVLLDQHNAINYENISQAIVRLLANQQTSSNHDFVNKMHFGNGGSSIDGSGTVTYLSPNTNSATGVLHNKTFEKIVDPNDAGVDTSTTNTMATSHTSGDLFSDLVVTCTLNYNEPSGQDTLDTATNISGTYIFDELGLYTATGNLLTHIIFHPIQKSANRQIQVIYTVRVRAGAF